MCPTIYTFDISGKITNVKFKSDDFNHDFEIIENLNKKKKNIEREIEEEIKFRLSKKILLKSITVQLSFQKGSILAVGLIIIETMAAVGGAISLVEFIMRLIRRIIERNVRNHLPFNNDDYDVSINISPRMIPSEVNQMLPEEQVNSFRIPFPKLLFYITLINITLFLGGTLFNVIQIPSILEKQEEARAKLSEAKEKLNTANQLLNSTKLNYQLNSSELEVIKNNVISKGEDVEAEIISQSNIIKSKISETETKLSTELSKITDLNKDISKSGNRLDAINKDISILQEENIKFGFLQIWNYMNIGLKVILGIVLGCSIFLVALGGVKLASWIKKISQ